MLFKLVRTIAAVVVAIVLWLALAFVLIAVSKELGTERWFNEVSAGIVSAIMSLQFLKPILRAIWN